MNSNKSISASFTTGGTEPDVAAFTGWVSGTTNTKVAGAEPLMVVMVMGESASDFSVSSVTYGGQTMTMV